MRREEWGAHDRVLGRLRIGYDSVRLGMKVHLRFDGNNEQHSKLTLFIDGASTGQLVMSPAQAICLSHVLKVGCGMMSPPGVTPVEFIESGQAPCVSTGLIGDILGELEELE